MAMKRKRWIDMKGIENLALTRNFRERKVDLSTQLSSLDI